jgi:pyruvate dehydrogenase E2 component (dihydrolipoamide acetyltransferase)
MSQVVVPDIGDFKEVEVIEVLVKPGDAVSKEQSLVTLESDKATMEIPSPEAGVVKEIKIKMGDKVSQGTPILVLDSAEKAKAEEKAKPAEKPKAEEKPKPEEKPQKPPPSAKTESLTVPVPDIGDFKEVEVIEVLVKPGDAVAKEQSLITLESDKATMEIPAPAGGVVRELKVKVGDKVAKGSPILVMESGAAAPPESRAEKREAAEKPRPASAPAPAPAVSAAPSARPVPREPRDETVAKAHASPSVRKFARELGVDLSKVQPSGPKGRVLHTDVQAFVKGALSSSKTQTAVTAKGGAGLPFNLPAWPEVDFAKFGPIESKPLSRIQKLSGPYLHRNWISIPHVTQFDEADITDLEAFRKAQTVETEKKGFKLTMLAFMIKACVTALKQFPNFNSSLDKSGENLIVKKYYHIGVAVDTPGGLVVPVVRDADRKGVFDLAHELAEISKLARDQKLKPGDMQGGTFSISSLGGIGGTQFTPIINAPEVAILGVARSAFRPVYSGKDEKGEDKFHARLILPLALSYDHRAIDGASGARFTSYLVSVLSDIRKLIL